MRLLTLIITFIFTLTATVSAEVRGVWISTCLGLDWPAGCYDPVRQRRQLTDMLDRLEHAHFNMVVFQVQYNGDVAWPSRLQPPMQAITGDGSRDLDYDVCRFVIDECHRRGMECHAWIVPFRVGGDKHVNAYAANKVKHVVNARPEWCVKYQGTYYIDPSEKEARKWLIGVYREMLDKYDFDGISLDYTRYPGSDFPDSKSYSRHGRKKPLEEWRRENINTFVAELTEMARSKRRDITIGSAPIGAYRNVNGTRNATALQYCQDPVAWAAKGHDLVIPQLYWDESAGFSTHISTWCSELPSTRIVAGIAPYRMTDKTGWKASDIIAQMKKIALNPKVEGVCFFRAEHVVGSHPQVKLLYDYLVKNPPAKTPSEAAENPVPESDPLTSAFLD